MLSTISGYTVKAEYNGIPYTVHTKEGFRGINIPCLVWFDAGQWHVTVQGRNIPVKYAVCDNKFLGHNHPYMKACYNDWRNP